MDTASLIIGILVMVLFINLLVTYIFLIANINHSIYTILKWIWVPLLFGVILIAITVVLILSEDDEK